MRDMRHISKAEQALHSYTRPHSSKPLPKSSLQGYAEAAEPHIPGSEAQTDPSL